ncbi:MAG: hypothetical protein PV344_02225 [Anaplasma sp.]|nr:hypothetical protein [Anaplasma sp.]
MSSFNHFHSTRDLTFHVSVRNPRARSCGCDVMTPWTNLRFSRHTTDAGFPTTRAR